MRLAVVYGIFVGLPALAVLLILGAGRGLPPPVSAALPNPADSLPAASIVLRLPVFLTQIIIIISLSRLLGALLRRIGQPQVVGEMLAGLALGPSLLGTVAPDLYHALFPLGTVRFITALSQIGLVLFMFLLGLELDLGRIGIRKRVALAVSHAGIAIPMLGGAVIALFLYRDYSTAATGFPAFALFLGCAMSVTAFPVLARILDARRLTGTPFGSMAMACAAVADVSAWVVLAVVVALARGGRDAAAGVVWLTLGGLAVYLAVMALAVRPALRRLWSGGGGRAGTEAGSAGQGWLAGVVLVILLSALATELLHVHALFGAFVAGLVMPRDESLHDAIRTRFEDLMSVLFLPLFFAYAGLRTNVNLLSSPAHLLLCLLVIAVAVAGKLGGSALAARAGGIGWRDAGALGVLMNARGLMELVLLTIGLQLGVITPVLFAIMVIMAIATTLMAPPLLALLLPARRVEPEAALRSRSFP